MACRSRGTLKLTVLEDEYRMATVGRVAAYALVGRKIRCHRRPPVAPALWYWSARARV